MENGRSYDEVVDKAVEVVNSGITQRPDFDIDSLGEIKVCGAFCAFCGAFRLIIRYTKNVLIPLRAYDFFECILEAVLDEVHYIAVGVVHEDKELRCTVMTV